MHPIARHECLAEVAAVIGQLLQPLTCQPTRGRLLIDERQDCNTKGIYGARLHLQLPDVALVM